MRLIDVDELLKKLQEVKDEDPINLLVAREKVIEIILNAPPLIKCGITSEGLPLMDLTPRPQGKWYRTGQSFINPNKFINYGCSVCHYELYEHIREKPNFCPNCGADMRGVDK